MEYRYCANEMKLLRCIVDVRVRNDDKDVESFGIAASSRNRAMNIAVPALFFTI